MPPDLVYTPLDMTSTDAPLDVIIGTMAEKKHVTRTFGPIHFEDLDAHRFEDLVRELIYEFRDWQTIEATGRSGGDEGFDVRAFEKVGAQLTFEEEKDEEAEAVPRLPMEGNQWMIQCKREKEIGPSRIVKIIEEGVDKKNPPFGYILAAPVNFSKKSYDAFRDKLRELGVMEYYLWGKAELEDMLHMPKNDRLLFTYFGISLVSRRRSRATDIRSVVATKNKLYSVVFDNITRTFNTEILVRDIKDTKYPFSNEYSDFKKNPRWREYFAFQYDPLGVLVHSREYYAYIDPIKKEWDFTPLVDLIHRKADEDEKERDELLALRDKVQDFWEHLPRRYKARLFIDGLIRFEDIVVIDGKGDSLFNCPHLFVDFKPQRGPFFGFLDHIKTEGGQQFHDLANEFKRVKIFPEQFPEPKIGSIHKDKTVEFDAQTLDLFKRGSDRANVFYDCETKYDFLNQRDVIKVKGADDRYGAKFIQITYKSTMKADEYLKDDDMGYLKESIERQIGRELNLTDTLTIFEFKRVYNVEVERKSGIKLQ